MVYCEAKRILTAYENKEGSIHSLIAKSLCPHKNSLTCLIMKVLCYKKLLKKIVKRSEMLEREKFLGDKLAILLVYDVLFGMGVRGKFKGTMKRNFESVNQALEHYMKKYACQNRDDLLKKFEEINQSSQIKKPKYVYLNTLVEAKKSLLKQLKEDGFVTIEYEPPPLQLAVEEPAMETEEAGEEAAAAAKEEALVNAKMKQLKEFLLAMKDNEFLRDDHIRHLLIFSPKSAINMTYRLFQEGHLLQIDKSSCLVPIALDPPENSHCIDAAAAPGNKTILLSTILKNTGLIHAFDIDEERVKLMSENLKQHHVKNVRLKCMDFLETEPDKYDRVEYILLDPSCSGSGMTNRLKFGDHDLETQKDEKRLSNLSRLQRKMVLHAMSFPSVKRIVYSTCSIHEEENERVVRHVLDKCQGAFRLRNLFENVDGSRSPLSSYSRGLVKNSHDKNKLHLDYCVRMSYDRTFTNGFFISCFEKVEDDAVVADSPAPEEEAAPAEE